MSEAGGLGTILWALQLELTAKAMGVDESPSGVCLEGKEWLIWEKKWKIRNKNQNTSIHKKLKSKVNKRD